MASGTTVDGFQAAIFAALRARSGMSGVLLRDGIPKPGELKKKVWVAFLDVDVDRTPVTMSKESQPRQESYEQEVMIAATVETRGDNSSPSAKVFAIYRELTRLEVENPALTGFYTGDGFITRFLLSEWQLEKRADDTTRESTMTLKIEVLARL